MFVSVEAITTIAAAVSIIVAFAGLLGWFIRRLDARFDRLEDRVSGVEHELTEVKIAVARLEGPTPRLVTAR
jgi:hypothetical protein